MGTSRLRHAEAITTFYRGALQSVSEFPSAVWRAGNDHGPEGKATPAVSLIRDTVGAVTAAGRLAAYLKPGPQWQPRTPGRCSQRHACRARHAGGQTEALRQSSARNGAHEDGCGNDGLWTPRKTKTRFPSAPTAFANRYAIPTFPQPRRQWKSGKPKPAFPLFHCHCCTHRLIGTQK